MLPAFIPGGERMELCNCINRIELIQKYFILLIAAMKTTILEFASRVRANPLEKARQEAEERNILAGQLLNSYGNAILRLAYSYLHNMSDAEEILQDTILRYLERRPKFESQEHEKAWLFRVAVNQSKNRIDYNKLRQTDELEESLAAQTPEDLSFVWEAVKHLPQQYREVIHLFYYEGYATREIAKILKKKESSIRSDLFRGRAKLRELLEEVYDFE